MSVLVRLEPLPDGWVRVRTPEGLIDDGWARFLDASRSAGSSYSSTLRQQTLQAAKVAEYAQAMQRAGYAVEVHPDVAADAARDRAEAVKLATVAMDRVERMQIQGHTLREYQKIGAGWMASRTRGILGDAPGVGKTPQCVASWEKGARVVVVCPRVAIPVWIHHVAWRGADFQAVPVKTRVHFRWPLPGEVVVVNFEKAPSAETLEDEDSELRRSCPEGLEVDVDEGQLAKNEGTDRGGAAFALCRLARARHGRTFVVTGTPLDNHPPDLYSMVRLAGLEDQSWATVDAFCSDFGGHARGGKNQQWSRDGVSDRVPTILKRVMLRREKEDVMPELPAKTWTHLPVEIPADVAAIADEAVAALAAVGVEVSDTHGRGCGCLACKVDLAQRTQRGPIPFDLISKARSALATAKLPALREIVELMAAGGPMLAWSCHLAPLRAMVAERPGWELVTGDTTNKRRKTITDAFQLGKIPGLGLTQHEAIGVSMTLTAAWRSLHVDMPFKSTTLQQCEDRIHRYGQANACEYTYMVADHRLDRWLTAMIGHKAGIEAASVRAASVPGLGLEGALIGPPELDASVIVSASSDARRPARPRERMLAAWLGASDARVAQAFAAELKRLGGLTEAQWVAAARAAAGAR